METIKYKNLTIEISQDEFCESPNEWESSDIFLIYNHRDLYVERKGFNPDEIFEHCSNIKKWFYEGYYVFPVYAYIHSGIVLSLSKSNYPFTCNFDTSFKGFILVSRKYWYHRKKAYNAAEGLIETWNQYLCGDVYYFTIKDNEDNVIDSCSGFYGFEDCKNEAINAAKHCYKQTLKNFFKRKKIEIINKIPLNKRLILA